MNKNYIKRGDIVRCTSGANKGKDYILVRITSGKDVHKDFMGNDLKGAYAQTRYAYNLLNFENGKMRQTEAGRVLVLCQDGTTNTCWQGISIHTLEKHFGMTFEVVADMPSISADTKAAVDTKILADFIAQVRDALTPKAALPTTGYTTPVWNAQPVYAY